MDFLPIAAVVEDQILCVSGGLCPNFKTLDDIRLANRITQFRENLDLIIFGQADVGRQGFQPGHNGVGYCYNEDITTEFLQTNDLKLLCCSAYCPRLGH